MSPENCPHEFLCEFFLSLFFYEHFWAMYKTMNTGTGKGMLGTREIGGMLYSGECPKTFLGMSPNIPGDVLKHSGECHQTFRGMSRKILGNVAKHSGE